MNWSHSRVLVTGAGGFIGSHLTERLVALGARTRALVHYNSSNSWGCLDESPCRTEIEFVAGDIRDPDTLRPALEGIDVVFHLASLIAIPYSYTTPQSYVRTNVEGTLNVCRAGLDGGVSRFVHTSTSETYGTALYVPIDEHHPLQGQSPYSASKIGADQMAEAFHRSYGLPVATIRPFNTYGPRQSARAIIPTIVTQALTGTVVRLGSLTPRRDFTFVADMVDAFVRTAETPEAVGQVINVGSGQEIAIGELAEVIFELTGRRLPIECDERRERPGASEVNRLCANASRAKELLAWRPRCSLRDGLRQTIGWAEQHLDRYKAGTYTI